MEKKVCNDSNLLNLDKILNEKYEKCKNRRQQILLSKGDHTPINVKFQNEWLHFAKTYEHSLKAYYQDKIEQLEYCSGEGKIDLTNEPVDLSKAEYQWHKIKFNNLVIIRYPLLVKNISDFYVKKINKDILSLVAKLSNESMSCHFQPTL